jgi:hypothetical protein
VDDKPWVPGANKDLDHMLDRLGVQPRRPVPSPVDVQKVIRQSANAWLVMAIVFAASFGIGGIWYFTWEVAARTGPTVPARIVSLGHGKSDAVLVDFVTTDGRPMTRVEVPDIDWNAGLQIGQVITIQYSRQHPDRDVHDTRPTTSPWVLMAFGICVAAVTLLLGVRHWANTMRHLRGR